MQPSTATAAAAEAGTSTLLELASIVIPGRRQVQQQKQKQAHYLNLPALSYLAPAIM
jgi:hypothetical protein